MSIHAQLSPEAQAQLDANKRNSTITSIVIAFLSLVLIALLLAFLFSKTYPVDLRVMVTYKQASITDDPITTKKLSTSSRHKPSAPAPSSKKYIAAKMTADVAIPMPDVDSPLPSLASGAGEQDDFGDGWFDGRDNGSGSSFSPIPSSMRKRCSPEDRMDRLAETGGTPQCEDSVLKALRWMKSTQAADGSWGQNDKAAMTGLGLLAYLGHCETPISEEFGDSCLRAMTFLINLGMKDGKLSQNVADKHWCYEHAIATYALAESVTFCHQLNVTVPNLDAVTLKAGQFIIDNQHPSGGWAYSYEESDGAHVDVSITGWHIQALKAMKHTGLDYRNLTRCAKKSLHYLADKQSPDGGFGYTNQGLHGGLDYHTLTGVGVLCNQIWGNDAGNAVRQGAKYIAQKSKLSWGSEFADLYGHYYEAQAMMNRGGDAWKNYNAMMRDEVLANQNPDGTWKSPDGKLRAVGAQFQGDNAQSVFYRTALCTLMMEVYYRFLPSTGSH